MTDFPDLKIKALVNFPATVLDGTGIDVTKANGTYRFDLDFSDFAPPVAGLADPAHQNALLWNQSTGVYSLAPVTLFGGSGGIPDAPNDGTQYGRQSAGWTAVSPPVTPSGSLPLMDGTATAGIASVYTRGDHVHPTDTSRAPNTFVQAGTGAVARTPQDKGRDLVSVRDFGATGLGVADDKVAIQAAFDSVPRPGAAPPSTSPFTKPRLTVFVPAGIYNVSAPLILPSGVSLRIDFGATIRATATMAAVITTAEATYLDQHNESMIYGGGTIDANGFADHAIWLKYFADFFVENISTYQANVSHIRLGSQTAPAKSYGAYIKDCLIRRDLTAFPANLYGVFFDFCGDSHIENTDIMGVKYGVASVSFASGGCFDSKFDRVHVWNPPLGGNSATVALSAGFAVQGTENIFTQCQVDGPFVSGGAGFYCLYPRNQLIGCSVNSFNSHLLASGVYYDPGAGVDSLVSGCTFKGASGSDKLAADVSGDYVGTTFTGNGTLNCNAVVSKQLRINGKLMQSGVVSTTPTAGVTAVTFPVAFSAAPVVTATMISAPSATSTETITVGSITTSGFNGYPRAIIGTGGPSSSNSNWHWTAIGSG